MSNNPLDELVAKHRSSGIAARELVHGDRDWVVCWNCPAKAGRNVRHPLRPGMEVHDSRDFAERHPSEAGHLVLRFNPDQMATAVKRAEHRKHLRHDRTRGFLDNASVLEAFGTVTAVDLTGIGIASSVTAGWCSNWFDNSSGLYLDVVAWAYFQAVNTAKANQNAIYFYGPGSFLTTDLPPNTAGTAPTNSSTTSATNTFLDITANAVGWPLLKVCPYITTNKPITSGGLFGFAKAHDMTCPKVVWLGMVNAAGPTIGTGGGTPTKLSWAGSYLTVA